MTDKIKPLTTTELRDLERKYNNNEAYFICYDLCRKQEEIVERLNKQSEIIEKQSKIIKRLTK